MTTHVPDLFLSTERAREAALALPGALVFKLGKDLNTALLPIVVVLDCEYPPLNVPTGTAFQTRKPPLVGYIHRWSQFTAIGMDGFFITGLGTVRIGIGKVNPGPFFTIVPFTFYPPINRAIGKGNGVSWEY